MRLTLHPVLLPSAALVLLVAVGGWQAFSPVSDSASSGELGETGALDPLRPKSGVKALPRPRWEGGINPAALPVSESARTRVLGTAWIPLGAFDVIEELKEGELVTFPLEAGAELAARVDRVLAEQGRHTVSGRLAQGARGSFVISRISGAGVTGQVLDQDRVLAYEFKQNSGRVVMAKLPLGEVVCEGIPLEPNHIKPIAGAEPRGARAIPALDSKPNAVGVLYLDFDGETVTDPMWNGGVTIVAQPAVMAGRPITAAQIADVWERVAEDFSPFNVSVTTIRSRYDNAPVGNRMRCIQTPTNDAAPSAGGVAYFKSYRAKFASANYRDDIPCWSFNSNNAAVMAMTISHELGHTFNLRHDGETDGTTYYAGHGSGGLRWGPIMGAPFSARVVQWSKGEYPTANNQEDDVTITKNVLEEANGPNTGYRTDEAGGTVATAASLGILATISKTGIIHSATDRDYYEFRTSGGPINVTVTLANEPNLDPRLSIVNGSNSTVATGSFPLTSPGASLSTTLAAGTYYLVVQGGGRPAEPDEPGYSSYGSIGQYTLGGSYVPLPESPIILTHPTPMTTLREGSKLTLSGSALSNSPISYRWKRNGALLPGKTTATLVIDPVNHTHAGSYVLEAVNAAGVAASNPAVVAVQYKPVFSVQPSPATLIRPAGASVALSASAHGTGVVSYQWRKNGMALAGNPSASTPDLVINDLTWFDGGSYTCVCTNAFGATTSQSVNLTVTSAPYFTTPGASTVPVAKNSTFTLRTPLVGSPTIRYQWLKGSTILAGATKATLTLTRASEAVHEGDPYILRATNAHGVTSSAPITVDVQDPPAVMVTSPLIVNSVAGASVTLSVAATGTPNLSYQWYHDNKLLLGSTAPELTIPSLHWTHRGSYKCVVTNAVGKATSKSIKLALTSPAVVLSSPASMKIATRGTGILKVLAGGTPTLKYQWYKDGQIIPGATKASLTLARASSATEGSYHVEVFNLLNLMPDVSAAAMVRVENAPAIAQHPVTTYAPIGGTATLSVTATSDSAPVLRYQWYKGKTVLVGQNSSSLQFTNLTTAQSGSYHVVITNDVGRLTSRAATLYVQQAPSIVSHPADRRHYAYDTATFTVKAAGAAPLTYTWHHNGGPPIPGATGPTLTLKQVQDSAAGEYHCVVRNRVGTATSNTARLDVDPVPPPSFNSFSPGVAAVGHRVRLYGSNLNWTTQVKINTSICSFVKVSASELLITVPSGARTGVLTVATYGGTFTTPASLVITTGMTNNMFANAMILVGSSVTGAGTNVGANVELGEPAYWSGQTVWYRWRCPASGSYTLNSDSTLFGHTAQVFSGSTLNSLNTRALTYRYTGTFGIVQRSGPRAWDALIHEDYYIRVDGRAETGSGITTGSISFTISPTPSLSQAYGAQAVPPNSDAEVMPSPPEFDLPFVSSVSGAGTFKTSFEAGSRSSAFEWRAFAKGGAPLFALQFDSARHSITGLDHDGIALDTHQVYSGVGLYDMELEMDISTGRWSVLLNGQQVVGQQPWQRDAGGLPLTPECVVLKPIDASSGALPKIHSAEWLSEESALENTSSSIEE